MTRGLDKEGRKLNIKKKNKTQRLEYSAKKYDMKKRWSEIIFNGEEHGTFNRWNQGANSLADVSKIGQFSISAMP